MEALYDHVLDLLRRLRAVGRTEDADALLNALTKACNQREILMELRYATIDVDEADLPPDLVEAKQGLLAELERQWSDLPDRR